jgi:hypothetical protein
MTEIDVRPNAAVTPDGFHLEPTYDRLVAETGFDPEFGAADESADSGLPEGGLGVPTEFAGAQVHPIIGPR